MTSVQMVSEVLTVTETALQQVTLSPIVSSDVVAVTSVISVPPEIITETQVAVPLSTVVVTQFSTITRVVTDFETLLNTLPAEMSTVTIETQVLITAPPETSLTTLTLTESAPTMVVTSVVEETVSMPVTVTQTVQASPIIITDFQHELETVIAPPVITAVYSTVTFIPIPNIVISTIQVTVPVTSIVEETEVMTLTSVIPERMTTTVYSTQLTTEIVTQTEIVPPDTLITTILETETETVLTLTRTMTVVQTITSLETFTLTSIIPSTVVVTPLMLNRGGHDHGSPYANTCVCPTLSCPSVICTPCTVTVTAPGPTVPLLQVI